MTPFSEWNPVALNRLSDDALKRRFAEVYDRAPPLFMRRRMLLLSVGFALQEAAAGGVDRALVERLAKLDADFDADGKVALFKAPVAKPGTRLLRSWQGVTHTVTVTPSGFTYQDEHYRSLSAIARKITGTQWSGPKFFGVEADRS